jgi:hypothetical protein
MSPESEEELRAGLKDCTGVRERGRVAIGLADRVGLKDCVGVPERVRVAIGLADRVGNGGKAQTASMDGTPGPTEHAVVVKLARSQTLPNEPVSK